LSVIWDEALGSSGEGNSASILNEAADILRSNYGVVIKALFIKRLVSAPFSQVQNSQTALEALPTPRPKRSGMRDKTTGVAVKF